VLAGLWKNPSQPFLRSGYVIDSDGYRPNVGIILANSAGQVLWAKRIGQDAWQFPQGGIQRGEAPRDALLRELHEELGLSHDDVEILAVTQGWLRYQLPKRYVRQGRGRICIGQKQKWFLLRLIAPEDRVHFDASPTPEFDGWRWIDWWTPASEVIEFKREVYRRALDELAAAAGIAGRSAADDASA